MNQALIKETDIQKASTVTQTLLVNRTRLTKRHTERKTMDYYWVDQHCKLSSIPHNKRLQIKNQSQLYTSVISIYLETEIAVPVSDFEMREEKKRKDTHKMKRDC